MRFPFLALVLTAAFVQNARSVEITFETSVITRDVPVSIVVVDPEQSDVTGYTVTARYYPNSIAESTVPVGVTDSTGAVIWTPIHAGMVTLSAKRDGIEVSRSVGVRFPALPGGAVVVFFFAGIVLLGGAGWSLVRLMEHEPKHGLK